MYLFDQIFIFDRFLLFSESTGEDEEETGQGSAPSKKSSGGGADMYIEIPRSEQPQPVTCFLEKPGTDKKVKVSII